MGKSVEGKMRRYAASGNANRSADAEERKLPSLRKICLFMSRGNAEMEEGVFAARLYII